MNGKPVSGTAEWAERNHNIQTGCENGCAYCYAEAMAVRFKRVPAAHWVKPYGNTKRLCRRWRKTPGRWMFPTTHDITDLNLEYCCRTLVDMLGVGNRVLIVTKPRKDCVQALCKVLVKWQKQVTWRFTIGTVSDEVAQRWESGAPLIGERLNALEQAWIGGWETSVSCEPMLDTDTVGVVEMCREYVTDSIWIGRANRLRNCVAVNRPGDLVAKKMADDLVRDVSDDYVRWLYAQYKGDSLVKWKDSVKKVVGIERPTVKGLDR